MISITEDQVENGQLLRVKGSVDLDSSPKLREKLLAYISKKQNIMVDLSEVKYIDSSGIATLLEGFQNTKSYGGSFILFSMSEPIRSVFELARLDRIFEIYNDEKEAIANCGKG